MMLLKAALMARSGQKHFSSGGKRQVLVGEIPTKDPGFLVLKTPTEGPVSLVGETPTTIYISSDGAGKSALP